MGLADWITGTKCADCGLKIQGPKFSRVIFGSEVWVCGACQEKLKAEQKKDRDDSAQRRQQESDAAIRRRSDEDIAEVLSRSALRQYSGLAKEVSDITGGEIELNRIPAFMFVLFGESSVFRKLYELQFEEVRVRRIYELFARYSLARFIHGTVRNSPPGEVTEPINRAALLSELMTEFKRTSEVHQKNFAILLDVLAKDPTKIKEFILGFDISQFLVPKEKFVELLSSDKDKFRRLHLCMVQILTRSTALPSPNPLELAAIVTPVNRVIAVELPDSWLLRQTDPWFLYYDPCTPQYNLAVSVRTVTSDKTPIEVVRNALRINGLDKEPEMLSPTRATAHYRIDGQEVGEAKEDYHWILVDQHTTQLRYALFTLSTLAGRADSNVTADLVQTLHPRIQRSRFLM